MQGILEQVSLSSSLERTKNLHIAGVGRQYNHLCVGKFISDSNECLDPIHLRHLQIHQRDVGMEHPELLDGLATVGRLTDHNHVRLNANQSRYSVANQCMVVNRKDSNLRASGAHDRLRISFHALPSRQTFVKLTNSLEPWRKRYRQGGAIPLPFLRPLRSIRSA